MAKVHFFYSSMNAGKTTHLLQANYNYINDGFTTMLIKPKIDDRFGVDKITSRLGCEADAIPIGSEQSIKDLVLKTHKENKIDFILADEVQFFSHKQIHELGYLADQHGITIMAYGLRNDFMGQLFEGTKTLFEISNNLTEIKKICHCGQKATMVLRYDQYGIVAKSGNVVEIGAEDKYVSVCRKDFFEADIGNQARLAIENSKIVFSEKHQKRIKKEKYANIISRCMDWNFKRSLLFSNSDIKITLLKIKSNISESTLIFDSLSDDSMLKFQTEDLISRLDETYKELYKTQLL